MALDESFAATILKVRSPFGFSHFACTPDEITRTLGIAPDEVRRVGELRARPNGKTFKTPFSSWSIESRSESKDVNDHLRELLSRLEGAEERVRSEWGAPDFGVTYRATHLFSGNGPFYEADVIRGIATLGAELWQDIYAVEPEEEEDVE